MSIFTGNWFGFGRGAGGGDTGTTTSGGTEYTPGNGYKYQVFTYPNTDTYVQGSDTPGSVEMLLVAGGGGGGSYYGCLLYTSPSPRDRGGSRMPSSA